MEENGADMYMCGHDHNMQHIRASDFESFDYIVNGGGGRGLYEYSKLNERSVPKMVVVSVYVQVYFCKSLVIVILVI